MDLNQADPGPFRAQGGFWSKTSLATTDLPGIYLDRPRPSSPDFNTEAYDRITENEFTRVTENPLSTFSIDVDTASYSNVRRFLSERQLPPKDTVRIEELVNYFNYSYEPPRGEQPFAVHMESAAAPWNEKHLLVRFGLKGREIDLERRQPGNFVFLIDVSGSMEPANKLPLLKQALRLMVDNLNEGDRVAMVVYAGASGLVLPSTACSEKETILQAMERLEAGGSTNGGSGIRLAYQVAEKNFLREGINRVILATDGDFNIGVTNQGDLTRLIEEKARSGVFLTVLGFGMGNYKDSTLEKLADRGNGNYSYIDTLHEARKVLVEEIGSTLVTIAKDVKIQVEFNPAEVQAYRLVGYENRKLQDQDFNDDTKDAGEIGAGHTVTVFYEVVPPGVKIDLPPAVDPLKYQQPASGERDVHSAELLTLKLRYKEPGGSTSKLIQVPLKSSRRAFAKASEDFRFAASVAGFGMLLRDSAYKGSLTWDLLLEIGENSSGTDPHGYRKEFISLVRMARAISDLEGLER
jgi:Ca-activated chloride channel family protein